MVNYNAKLIMVFTPASDNCYKEALLYTYS